MYLRQVYWSRIFEGGSAEVNDSVWPLESQLLLHFLEGPPKKE